jgi:hypothetical protein
MSDNLGTKIKKAVVGDKQTEMIKSGTLVVTRGIGVVGIGLVGTFFVLDLTGTGPWKGMPPAQKLWFVLGAGLIWAIVAGADSVARGITKAAAHDRIVTLPPDLVGARTEGLDDHGWLATAAKFSRDGDQETVSFLVVKDNKAAWVKAKDFHFTG